MFQPTLPLRGATQAPPHDVALVRVSTHAPLAGSDRRRPPWRSTGCCFNPRSPCGERRPRTRGPRPRGRFNPRSPCGERPRRGRRRRTGSRFNPRSPCGERRGGATENSQHTVSTHAPLAGSDSIKWRAESTSRFQPTLPLRGATPHQPRYGLLLQVSTHAPLAGSDYCSPCCASSAACFNPRSPCGERQHGGRNRRHT